MANWRISDLIDLEYFLPGDETGADAASGPDISRDREIYLSYAKAHQPPFPRRDLLRYWLEARRGKTHAPGREAELPGAAFDESWRVARVLVIISALFFGASLSWSVLSYSGHEPINIFTCLWIFIVPQIALLSFLAITVLLHQVGIIGSFKSMYPLLSALVRRMAARMRNTGQDALSASRRSRISGVAGLIGKQKTLYGSVFLWPVFILAQLFGLCFNIGLLAATLLKLTITDLAFGWQSTLQLAPESVYELVHAISFPWVWFAPPPIGHPTLSQIAGSKMVLKEGIVGLTTANLVSWWPFLCFAILFYGFLPRLTLLLIGMWRRKAALDRIDFSHSACDRLIQHMQTPRVNTSSRIFSSEPGFSPAPAAAPKPPAEDSAAVRAEGGTALVVLPEDIDDKCDPNLLSERLGQILGLRVEKKIRSEMDPAQDRQAMQTLISGSKNADLRVVVLQEAWQPPIRETLEWIRALRGAVNDHTGMIIALIGKPAGQEIFTTPDDTDRVIWNQAVNGMGDPYIRVENLGG